MSAKNKVRGNHAEREFVRLAEAAGLQAQRAWGSNGQALGEHEEVDVIVESARGREKLQVKRRKQIADYLKPNANVDAQALYEDGRGSKSKGLYVVVTAERYFELLSIEISKDDRRGNGQLTKGLQDS